MWWPQIMVCELLRSRKTQLWSEKLQPVGAKYTLNLWHGVKNKRAPMQLQTKVSTSDKQSAGKWWVTNEPLCVWTGLRNDSRRREKKKWRVSSTCEEPFCLKRKHERNMNISCVPCTWFSTSVRNYIISLCSPFAMWCWIEIPISLVNFLEL